MDRDIARKYALQNAVLHGGRADAKAVTGKILAEQPELRSRAREIVGEVEAVVREVNALQAHAPRAELQELAPDLLEPKAPTGPAGHPPLPDAEGGNGVVPLAPHPSGPPH